MIEISKQCSRFLNVKLKKYRYSTITSVENTTNFVDKMWVPLILRTYWIDFPLISDKLWSPLFSWNWKIFPRTTTTNKPFLRLRQRSLAVKKVACFMGKIQTYSTVPISPPKIRQENFRWALLTQASYRPSFPGMISGSSTKTSTAEQQQPYAHTFEKQAISRRQQCVLCLKVWKIWSKNMWNQRCDVPFKQSWRISSIWRVF